MQEGIWIVFKDNTPKLSIVIPTFNRPNLVKRAIASAQVNYSAEVEIIVVDDGTMPLFSSDASFSHKLGKNVCVEKTRGKTGAAAARNLGVSKARSDLILFLDDDDELIPGYAQHLIDFADTHNQFEWGFSSTVENYHGSNLETIVEKVKHHTLPGTLSNGRSLKSVIGPFSAGFWCKKPVFLNLGGLCEDLLIDEDTDFCCRLYASESVGFYSNTLSVKVNKNWASNEQNAQLTSVLSAEKRVPYYLLTFKRNVEALKKRPWAIVFLASRYLRVVAKSDNAHGWSPCRNVVAAIDENWIKIYLFIFWMVKRLSYYLKSCMSWLNKRASFQ